MLHVLPQLWFRNTWSWRGLDGKPSLQSESNELVVAHHNRAGRLSLARSRERPSCCSARTKPTAGGCSGSKQTGHFKDAFHDYLIGGQRDAVNPQRHGTKAAAHYVLKVRAGRREHDPPAAAADRSTKSRSMISMLYLATAAARPTTFTPPCRPAIPMPNARLVQRQAMAGMIWNKQFYYYDVQQWLKGDPAQPHAAQARMHGRNPTGRI